MRLYLLTAVIFLALDALMLTFVMKPLFTRHLGDLMRDSPMLAAAAGFYLLYIAGLVVIVSAPALQANAPARAGWQGAIIGAMAYGTYEFTSMAIMRDWSWQMVIADTLWGTALTGFSAWAGVVIAARLAR